MDLRKTVFVLPNLLTAGGLFFGCMAILRCATPGVTDEDIYKATLLLFISLILDMFDGRVARMTRTQSAFGVEFDSLADLVSFGVAPAVIAYRWALDASGMVGIFVCALYVLCGAVRLSRFNVMSLEPGGGAKAPSKYMLGLPIPVAAGFIISLVVATRGTGQWPWLTSYGLTIRGIAYPMMVLVMGVLAFLMVSSVRFRSFKDLRLNAVTVTILVGVLIGSLVLWLYFKPAYVLIGLIGTYLLLGFFEAILGLTRRGREKWLSYR